MSVSRRQFLACVAGFTAAPFAGLLAQPRFERNPFSLGVASGYPGPDGVVLWTRLAPEPLAGGGMPDAAVEVAWEIATDEAFRRIVRNGKEIASPEWAHSIHAEVAGLEPGRRYFYRFHAGGATSPVGRTRTSPPIAAPEPLNFAFASCQQYEHGYYAAYRHMAHEDLDFVVHLGDYIYETTWGRNLVRSHQAGETVTLDEYRNRYALYKTDPDLQAAHAAFPWICTWDDHEVQNDYAGDRGQRAGPREEFLTRRAAAYRAYYEHLPLPKRMAPRGPDLQIYGRWNFGSLAQFLVLDDRQYRDHQACPRADFGGGSNVVSAANCPELMNPRRTLLGARQEQWLADGLSATRAHWNVIAQQTIMAQVSRPLNGEKSFWTDGWDGYPHARARLLEAVAGSRVANPVVIGGDIHTFAACDLKADFDDLNSPVVATEFVGSSITSQGIAAKTIETWRDQNPHIRYINSTRRGYVAMALSTKRCVARMRAVDEKNSASPVTTLAAWTVESGHPGAQRGA